MQVATLKEAIVTHMEDHANDLETADAGWTAVVASDVLLFFHVKSTNSRFRRASVAVRLSLFRVVPC